MCRFGQAGVFYIAPSFSMASTIIMSCRLKATRRLARSGLLVVKGQSSRLARLSVLAQSVDHRMPTTIAVAEYCGPPFRINRKACMCRVAPYLSQFYSYKRCRRHHRSRRRLGPSERTTAPSHQTEERTNPSCVIPRYFLANVGVAPNNNTSHIYDGRIFLTGGKRHRRVDKRENVNRQHFTAALLDRALWRASSMPSFGGGHWTSSLRRSRWKRNELHCGRDSPASRPSRKHDRERS
jgi:hypothetical protein